MRVFPTDEEIEDATKLLVERFQITSHFLGKLLGVGRRDEAKFILRKIDLQEPNHIDITRLLIYQKGSSLFSGNEEAVRDLRRKLLDKLSDEEIRKLFREFKPNDTLSSTAHMRTNLAKMKWNPGKKWAKSFVRAIGFPEIFSGPKASFQNDSPSFQDVLPLRRPPNLVDFQTHLKNKMCDVLKREGSQTRCIVTLPTGGGKTRIAVEAFIEWMRPRFAEKKYLIWIAQSEELCEQAISCIDQMWRFREFTEPLRIYRFFGGKSIPEDKLCGGVVVASIQQLHARIDSSVLKEIISNTGAMIIDEAHRSITSMYNKLFDKSIEICGPGLFPICGLTATPGRSGVSSTQETEQLVGRFNAYLIKPDLGKDYDNSPLKYFRDNKFLAKAYHTTYKSGVKHDLGEEVSVDDQQQDFPDALLKKLAHDKKRNLLILKELLLFPKGASVLVYACTVEHAYFLASMLSNKGRAAMALSANTPLTTRHEVIHKFREREIEFLLNYSVLTTGFDAPKVSHIVLCRPTRSDVLYEQIIGRGLRGPKFGGTEGCKIIDFADNITSLGPPLAYTRFQDFWNTEEEK